MLIRLLAGLTCPTRGSLRILGKAPHQSPALRRHLGTLVAHEETLPGATLSLALKQILAAQGNEHTRVASILSAAHLSESRELAPESLSQEERRRLALQIALNTPAPKLLALFEPLMFYDAAFRGQVLANIHALARDVPVVCVTSSLTDANTIGGAVFYLDAQGVLSGGLSADESRRFQVNPSVLLECGRPEVLAKALSGRPGVNEVRWLEQQGEGLVEVFGEDTLALASAVAGAAADAGHDIKSLRFTSGTSRLRSSEVHRP